MRNVLLAALLASGCGGTAKSYWSTTSSSSSDAGSPFGLCIGVQCPPPRDCQNPGVCNPSTGLCTYSPLPDGQVCDDGNACTLSDACQSGECVGGSTETCAAADQCHGVGTCDPKTGCSNVSEPDGTPCDDGNLCTQSDACQMGICQGTPLACHSGNACAPTGKCNAGTGQCAYQPAPQGTACTLYTGTADETPSTCDAGVCQSSCPVGYTDCNHNLATDGCEAFTGGDPQNCGGCGVQCSSTNVAMLACTGGQCTSTCVAGYADCQGTEQTTGCQTNTTNDAANCGSCGIACFHGGDHGVSTSSCVSSKCQGVCVAGRGDCNDDVASDGCEIDLTSDPNNCGSCGRQCPTGRTCVGGECYVSYYTLSQAPAASANPPNWECRYACLLQFGNADPAGGPWHYECSTVPGSINNQENALDHEYFPTRQLGFKRCVVTFDGNVMAFNWNDWYGQESLSAYVNDPDPAFASCLDLPNYCFVRETTGVQ